MLDAAFEGALGVLILILTVFIGGVRMPAPAGQGLIVGVAILLLLLAAVLALLAQRPTGKLVSGVALANVTSAFVLTFWLIAGWRSFSGSGLIILGVTVAGLILVALAELLATMAPAAD